MKKIGKYKIYPTHFEGNENINDILSSMLNNNMVGQVTNLGDSGILIGRPSTGEILFRTPQQEHNFGFPYQLGHEGIASERGVREFWRKGVRGIEREELTWH